MKKSRVLLLTFLIWSCILSSIAFADCTTADECLNDRAMTGIGKINNTLRAVFFELQETNKILREKGADNGIVQCEFKPRRSSEN